MFLAIPGSPGQSWLTGRNEQLASIDGLLPRRSSNLPVNTYEGMFLLDSTKAATAWEDTVKHVHDILTKHHSEIVASRQWDERRLAYPIEGHKKGTYLLTYFKTSGESLKEIVADCHLSDLILRELILKVHPKLEEHLVNQAMTSTPNVDAEDSRGSEIGRASCRERV